MILQLVILGVVFAKQQCVFVVARRQRIPGRHPSRCWSALRLWTHSIKMCLFSLESLSTNSSLFFFGGGGGGGGSICSPVSPQEAVSIADVSLCHVTSVKPVFSLILPNCNFPSLLPHLLLSVFNPAGARHVESCTSLLMCSLSRGSAGWWVFPQMLSRSRKQNRSFSANVKPFNVSLPKLFSNKVLKAAVMFGSAWRDLQILACP